MSDWNRIDPPAAVFGWPNSWLMQLLGGIARDLPAMAKEKGMHATVGEALRRMATSRKETQKHLAEVEAQRDAALAEIERLTEDRDKAWDRIDQLTHFLLLAHNCIRHGFMDGEWATIVQTQKTLLPSGAVMEAKNAEKVFNAIGRDLNIDGRDE